MHSTAVPGAPAKFQSTFPRGERPYQLWLAAEGKKFQSTFPRGERRVSLPKYFISKLVSIHVPARGTTICTDLALSPIRFQSTFPRGERQERSLIPDEGRRFQSTFPRGERHRAAKLIHSKTVVSIHVPARGTTVPVYKYEIYADGFNPRSREGNDLKDRFVQAEIQQVSIHVPARGTTAMIQPCSRKLFVFQSTFPRGERLKRGVASYSAYSFNPRSREGNDSKTHTTLQTLCSFQSTFPRGERRQNYREE